ncbi:hypothetical protein AAG570_003670 [Ranatra chinensis]|uniref:Uncharacterized protein n=1 Tax=Ranatra chinensis TaxID=642074 RepID=A0ABD0Y4E3_9HEMI
MASKRRNMFHKNKTQETTENGELSQSATVPILSRDDRLWKKMEGTDSGREVELVKENTITYSRLPATEPVEIRFQDLQYRVPSRERFSRSKYVYRLKQLRSV